jgi:ankyrin repeat protein
VDKLIAKHPEHASAITGWYGTPAVAALAGRHFQLAQVLHRNKSFVEPRGIVEDTPLHSAVSYGDLEMVQVSLEFGVDVNAMNTSGLTPLSYALFGGHHNGSRVAQLLIEHGAVERNRFPQCLLSPPLVFPLSPLSFPFFILDDIPTSQSLP